MDAADVADRVAGIKTRIEAAARRAARDASAVTLVAASKLQPIERLEAAFALEITR